MSNIIDEDHLARFKSESEANIHRQASIAKLKIGMLRYYMEYHMWMIEQRRKNEKAIEEENFIPVTNFDDVYHQTFESWLKHTRIINGKAKTRKKHKIVSFHPDFGYMGEDIMKAMGLPNQQVHDIQYQDSMA